jgi:hypothetical protein
MDKVMVFSPLIQVMDDVLVARAHQLPPESIVEKSTPSTIIIVAWPPGSAPLGLRREIE